MSHLLPAASVFADAVHARMAHVTRYDKQPYFTHSHAVASLCQSVGEKEHVIAAALLQDIATDCPGVTLGMIEHMFGANVAKLVQEASHYDGLHTGLNRSKRMAIELARAADISQDAKTIKIAGLIVDSQRIRQFDPEFAKVFMPEARRLTMVLMGGNFMLWQSLAHKVSEYFNPVPAPTVANHTHSAPAALASHTHTCTLGIVSASGEPEIDPASVWHSGNEAPTQDGIYERVFSDRSNLPRAPFAKFQAGSWYCMDATVSGASDETNVSCWQLDKEGDQWRGPVAPIVERTMFGVWIDGGTPASDGIYEREIGFASRSYFSSYKDGHWGYSKANLEDVTTHTDFLRLSSLHQASATSRYRRVADLPAPVPAPVASEWVEGGRPVRDGIFEREMVGCPAPARFSRYVNGEWKWTCVTLDDAKGRDPLAGRDSYHGHSLTARHRFVCDLPS